MSDAAVFTVVSGLITITTMLVGFLTLWVKLRYGGEKAAEAAVKAEEAVIRASAVENKIDIAAIAAAAARMDNTERMELLHKIDHQTNGMAAELAEARREIASLKQQLNVSRSHEGK